MADFIKVVAVIVTSTLVLLGSGTLIQLVEQLIRDPRVNHPDTNLPHTPRDSRRAA